MVQPFPERFKRFGTLAVTDEYDGAAFEVERYREIAMSLLHRNFIDGHVPEILEDRAREPLLEVPFLDIRDGIPGNREMPGYVEYGHVLRQFQDIPLKGAGIGEAGIGKPQVHLADRAALPACYPLDVEIQKDHLRSYRQRAKPPRHTSSQYEIPTSACRAMEFIPLVFHRENHLAFFICRPHIGVADKTESMIQKTCGHVSPPIRDAWSLLFMGLYVHIFFKGKVRFDRKNLNNVTRR